MLSKKPAAPPPEDEPPAEGFRKEMVGLFLRNHIAARKAASVCHKASKAKGQGVEDPAAMGANPQKPARHRDVLRRLLKHRHWPSLYYFQCEVTDLRTQEEVFATLPVWLPHEILQSLEQKTTSLKGLCDHSFLQSQEFEHLSKVANKLACSVDSLVGLSIWGDGVPFNNNRSHSLEMLSLSIMSCSDQGLRIPLAAFPKHLAAGPKTWNSVWNVMKWSLAWAATGIMPSHRHDGAPFDKTDTTRKKLALSPVPKGILVQIRGDWAFYKAVFGLPGWQEKRGCCWRCCMTPDKIHEVSSSSWWRQAHNRKNHWAAVAALDKATPLLGVPFFDMSIICLDWLHIMDIGVSLHWLGSVFVLLSEKLPGNNVDQRCKALHLRMKNYYKEYGIDSQMPLLKASMLYKDKKKSSSSASPKLRAKAGEAKGLILFSLLQCTALLNNRDSFEAAVIQCAQHLHNCYQQLSQQVFEPSALHREALKFAALYVTLNQISVQQGRQLFKVTPKLHLFLEMTFDPKASPSTGWTYRDEDWGGQMSELARRRGGNLTCLAVAQAMFHKFAALHQVPSL